MSWTLDPSNTQGGGITWVGPGPVPLVSGQERQQIIQQLQSQPQQGPQGGTSATAPNALTSTTQTQLPAWLQPYAQQFLSQYSNLAMPGGKPQQMPGNVNQQVAPFTPYQSQALSQFGAMTPAATDLAMTGAGSMFGTLAGNYLYPQSNPYLDATYAAAAKPMVANYEYATAPSTMAAAQHAGQMGGSAFNESQILNQFGLGSNLADLGAQIYGGNYQAERGRQMQALTQLPSTLQAMYQPASAMLGAGAYQQSQNQAGMDASFSNALRGAEWPYQALSGFGSAFGQAGGGTGVSTTTSGIPSAFMPSSSGLPSWLPYAIGGAGLAGPALSAIGGMGSIWGSGA